MISRSEDTDGGEALTFYIGSNKRNLDGQYRLQNRLLIQQYGSCVDSGSLIPLHFPELNFSSILTTQVKMIPEIFVSFNKLQ